MTAIDTSINFKGDFRETEDLRSQIEEEKTLEDKEFELFWDRFYPRIHARKERTIEEFEEIIREVNREVQELTEEDKKSSKKGEPDFHKIKQTLEDIHTRIKEDLKNLHTQMKDQAIPFRVGLGVIDAFNLVECTFEIIKQQVKIRFSHIRGQSRRWEKAEQIIKVIIGHMFLIFRMYEINDLLKSNKLKLLDEYLDYLSGDILQFTKLLIRYDFRPRVSERDEELLKKYGTIISFVVKKA